MEKEPGLNDFYTTVDKYEVIKLDREEYQEYMDGLDPEDKETLASGKQFYEVTVENIGGLVMPLIFRFEYTDGTEEIRRIPAEIWRMSKPTVTKVFVTNKEVTQISLDPYLETADTDISNNYWPPRPQPTRFELFKEKRGGSRGENPMQRYQRSED